MKQDQIVKLEALRDRLIEVAMIDADPLNWTAYGKKPVDMNKDERGDARWCRILATGTISLCMQMTRLLQNPITGGAVVPSEPGKSEPNEEELVEEEIKRYEKAATAVLSRASRGDRAKR